MYVAASLRSSMCSLVELNVLEIAGGDDVLLVGLNVHSFIVSLSPILSGLVRLSGLTVSAEKQLKPIHCMLSISP